jgi:hypothetical protein
MLDLSDPKGGIHSIPLRLEDYCREEKLGVIILTPEPPISGSLMMGRISRGPTQTASKARPSSFFFKNNSSTHCETCVPLGPNRPSSWPSPTSGSGLPEDPPTCQWAQST